MSAFWMSLAGVFGLELGDKTQLVALCLASRFNAKVVLSGIFCATLVVHVISVLLGGGVGKVLPGNWISLVAGLAFVGFGFWTLRGDALDDDECQNLQGRSPFWLVASTFFLAELGDKTMLGTVTLATDHSLIPVWLGSSLGMVVADGLAILVGSLLGKALPERPIKIGAAIIFFGFGLWKSAQGALTLPSYSWVLAACVIAIFLGLYIKGARQEPIPTTQPDLEPELVSVSSDSTANRKL
ncbi:MAG: TMEM165/GDT1 family protein [Armatimonadota bacterium]|nr:TMEM165/GDT1 family protein [bacterium]